MWDEPRRTFLDKLAFLAKARELIGAERVAWDPAHQTGHDAQKHEAEQVVYWALPRLTTQDPIPDRYDVRGYNRANRLIRVVASVRMDPDGDILCLVSFFYEHKVFGS